MRLPNIQRLHPKSQILPVKTTIEDTTLKSIRLRYQDHLIARCKIKESLRNKRQERKRQLKKKKEN